jgi:hypothetical protein
MGWRSPHFYKGIIPLKNEGLAMPATDLSIEYLPLGGPDAYPRNAHTHSRRQIRQIADTIKAFGFTNPVLIDDANVILAGHGRVEAAKLLGLDKVPCVRLGSMTAAQKKA